MICKTFLHFIAKVIAHKVFYIAGEYIILLEFPPS